MNGTRVKTHLYGWLCVLFAAIFYANFRSDTLIAQYLELFQSIHISALVLPAFIAQHLPSFLQACFIGYLAFHFFPHTQQKALHIGIATFLVTGTLEALQLTHLLPGTFDWFDLLAISIAGLIISLMASDIKHVPSTTKPALTGRFKNGLILSAFTSACIVSMGCYDGCDPDENTCVEPITLSWEDLRVDIKPTSGNTTTLTSAGKTYVNGNYLFVIDNYRGVHIFDQTDNQNPIRVVFIPVPGALTLSIQGDELYINSFTDFLVINYQKILEGAFDQTYVSRQENMFLPPAFTNFVPDEYALKGEPEDYENYIVRKSTTVQNLPALGFIIGYIDTEDSEVLYGEYEVTDDSDTSGD
ncbi:MAG: hypothetical protein ACI8SR_000867 [Oceanicoccus sp.]|jgi:hypothetical protein